MPAARSIVDGRGRGGNGRRVAEERSVGERVCAVIVPAPGATVTLETVAAHFAAQGIAKQKTPEQVEIVESIARNPMNKALKNEIRDRILAQS